MSHSVRSPGSTRGVHLGDRRRFTLQRRKQGAPRLSGVVQLNRLASEEQRHDQVLLGERGGGELSGVGDVGCRSGCVALSEGQVAHEQRSTSSTATPASSARIRRLVARPSGLALRRGPLEARNSRSTVVQVGLVRVRPVQRRGQPSASVQITVVTASLIPGTRGLRHVAVEPAAFRVVLEPARSLGQSRSNASCATSTVPSATVTRRPRLRLRALERHRRLGPDRIRSEGPSD